MSCLVIAYLSADGTHMQVFKSSQSESTCTDVPSRCRLPPPPLLPAHQQREMFLLLLWLPARQHLSLTQQLFPHTSCFPTVTTQTYDHLLVRARSRVFLKDFMLLSSSPHSCCLIQCVNFNSLPDEWHQIRAFDQRNSVSEKALEAEEACHHARVDSAAEQSSGYLCDTLPSFLRHCTPLL